MADGRVNAVPDAPTRTFGQIVRANVLTPVNAIIGVLFVLLCYGAFALIVSISEIIAHRYHVGVVFGRRKKK